MLLHGLMASNRVFDDVIAAGKKDFRFLTLDLPHSGKSFGWAQMKPEDIAQKIAPWLKSKGVRQATLVGHSFGGLVALELATQFPKTVKRLVVASAPGLGLSAQTKKLLYAPRVEKAAAMIGQLPMMKPFVRSYVGWLFANPRKVTDKHLEGYVESLKNPGAWPGMLEATRSVSGYQLQAAKLIASKIPIEVIWGERDRLVSLVDGERLAIALESGFTVLPDVGHCVPEEAPEAVLEAIRGNVPTRKARDRGRPAET